MLCRVLFERESLYFLTQTDGLIWVVDSADRWRLDDCRTELLNLLSQEVGTQAARKALCMTRAQKLAGASVLIFTNKQDMPGAMSSQEVAEALGLTPQQVGSRHWAVLPCSAITGDGLVEGVEWIVNDISERIFVMA
jgi:ADP-ribosylation factor-like protein 2